MQYLSNFVYDIFDDKYLNVAACASELKGKEGVDKDGIGTICHEFSHILGLPDIYDTRSGSGYGMGHYDVMDVGTYNGDGKIPCGYTAMDRYTLGWLEPIEITGAGKDFELKSLIDNNEAAVIVNPENNTEYLTLENRQLKGFDSGLPGHGLIVSQVHYDPKVWKGNTVNTPMISGYEHVRLLAADKNWLKTSEAGDPFPGDAGITGFGIPGVYEISWNTTSNMFDLPVTNIRESAEGTILFDYGHDAGISELHDKCLPIGEIIKAGAKVYSLSGHELSGKLLSPGIYILNYKGEVIKVKI